MDSTHRRQFRCRAVLACGIPSFLLCLPLAAAGQPGDLEAEIADLSKTVLAKPQDAAAAARLDELRQTQQTRRKDALKALETGLEAYLASQWATAAQELKKARACTAVESLADGLLVRPLGEIVSSCEDAAHAAPKPPRKLCPMCGNTGWADCPNPGCLGSGALRCRACEGRGRVPLGRPGTKRPSSSSSSTSSSSKECAECGGKGEAICGWCNGKGVVRCGCGARSAASDEEEPAPGTALGRAEAEAIRKVIAVARHLHGGGLDLESPAAFRRSPKLQR